MDSKPWFVLGFFLIVVGVPVIFGVLGDMYKRHLKFRERAMELMSAQTERLEQRMQVLERIITDRGLELSDEIERLRDRPLN